MGWIRIRMDLELLPRSGSRKIQSWIQIRIIPAPQHWLNGRKRPEV